MRKLFAFKYLRLLFLLLIVSSRSSAQTPIPSSGVSQGFEVMGSSLNLPLHWRISAAGAGTTGNYASGVSAVTQQASSGSPNTGASYNWGTTGDADRAVGFMTSGSYATPNSVMGYFRNTTGGAVTTLTIRFSIERYRINTAAFSLNFFSSTDGSVWTARTDGDIATGVFVTGASSYTFASPQTVVKTVTITGLNIANNGDIYFRWVFNNTGSTSSQGLGLDDVRIIPGTTSLTANLGDNVQDANANNQANPGETIIYRDTIKNTGTIEAVNVSVADTSAPAGTTKVTATVKTSAVAVDDSYISPYNTQVTGHSVLQNDFGFPAPSVLSYGTTASNGTAATSGTTATDNTGGTVSIVAGTGVFTYTPPANFTGTDQFKYIATTNIGLPDNDAVVTIRVAPQLTNDAYNVVGNTQLVADGHSTPSSPFTTSSTNILANDNAPAGTLSVTPVTDVATTNGGRITIDANGKFIYTPPTGSTAADSYTYTATSNGVSATAVINFTITNVVWYVRSGYVGTSTGRSHEPFTDVTSAATASAINQIIYVHTGSGNTTGNATLKTGQTLRGAGSALSVGALSIAAGTKPVLTGTVTLANSVVVDGFDMNTGSGTALTNGGTGVTGITVNVGNITTTTGTGVSVTGTGNTGTMIFASVTTGAAVNGITVTNFATPGTVSVNGGTITATTGTGINFASVTGVTLSGVTINQTSQTALALNATPITLNGNLIITTSGGGTGVSFGGGTASIAAGANTFSITNTSTGQGIAATAGTISITGSNNTISTQTGTALSIANTTVGAGGLTFANVSANGAANGINLNTVTGTGSITINAGTITGGAGAAFNVTGGSGLVTYSGSISQATASQALVSVAGGHSGTLTFQTGTLSTTNGTGLQFNNADGTYNFNGTTTLNGGDAGIDVTAASAGIFNFNSNTSIAGTTDPTNEVITVQNSTSTFTYSGTFNKTNGTRGIFITGNTAGTIAINGTGTKIITTTGANNAIDVTSNTGATINFSGNNLVLTTASGTGLNATGGGTISVTGTGNTITSPTGTALNVVSTTIGASGLTFQSISSASVAAPTGIILDNTGSTAGLTITGTGTAGSGGTIANKTGADGSTTNGIGIYLNNTQSPSFTRMQLNDHQNFAIRGLTVRGFTLANCVINGTNGNNVGADEASIYFTDLTGSAAVTNSTISGGAEDNLRISNSSGSLNRITVSGCTFNANGTSGNDAILLDGLGTATINATIQNNVFTAARANHVAVVFNFSSGGDIIINNNTLTNNHPNKLGSDFGILIGSTSNANVTYQVDGNSVRDAGGSGIEVDRLAGGSGSMTGSITNNIVGVSGTANSGSFAGSCIFVGLVGSGTTATHTSTVSGNTLRQFTNYGIGITNSGTGQGYLNLTITNNNIAEPSPNSVSGGFPTSAIRATLGVSSGPPAHDGKTCLDIFSNTINQTGTSISAEIRVFGRFSSKTAILGLGLSGASSNPDIFIANKNTITVAPGGLGAVNATSTNAFQSTCPPL